MLDDSKSGSRKNRNILPVPPTSFFYAKISFSKSLGRSHRPPTGQRSDTAAHWHAPHPRGDEPAGVWHVARSRAAGGVSAPHVCHGRPHRADRSVGRALHRPARAGDDGRTAEELCAVWNHVFRPGERQARHRAHRGAGAGHHPAGHDDRLRGLAHEHARCVWRDRVWHRHQPSARRAGDADDGSQRAQGAPHRGQREVAGGRVCEGRYIAHHPHARCERRHGLRLRIRGLDLRRLLDGRAHDGLQYVDRGRRSGRLRKSGRDDVRVPEGPALFAARRGVGCGRGDVEVFRLRSGRDV